MASTTFRRFQPKDQVEFFTKMKRRQSFALSEAGKAKTAGRE